MNRLKELFNNKHKNILSVYFTAGYPQLNDTPDILLALQESGADIIEIGMPFSDPVADGPTIQASNKKALDNGMNMKLLFEQLETLKDQTEAPLVLMGYLNPVMRYGVEAFLKKCSDIGVDGLILPDLPVKEYNTYYKQQFQEAGISNIFLITPHTSEERIREMDAASDSFIYMVSTPGITGAREGINEEQQTYFKRISKMNLKNPCLIGFGISNHESFNSACNYSNGAIIGSAFINVLSSRGNSKEAISGFIRNIKGVI